MKIIVDKIEENIATVEMPNGDIINVPSILLDGASEGDIVEITVCKDETVKRKIEIEDIINRLFEN